MQRDIFDDMMNRIGCSYVSNLKYNKKAIKDELKTMNVSAYGEKQLEEFAQYVFECSWDEVCNKAGR